MQINKPLILVIVFALVVGVAGGYFWGKRIVVAPVVTDQRVFSEEEALPQGDGEEASKEVDFGKLRLTHGAEFSPPYKIGWQENGATIVLEKTEGYDLIADDGKAKDDERMLSLFFRVTAGETRFCAESFKESLKRITSELGDLSAADRVSGDCVGGGSTLGGNRADFIVPKTEEETLILVFGNNGEQTTFFTIRLFPGGSIQADPAPTRG